MFSGFYELDDVRLSYRAITVLQLRPILFQEGTQLVLIPPKEYSS